MIYKEACCYGDNFDLLESALTSSYWLLQKTYYLYWTICSNPFRFFKCSSSKAIYMVLLKGNITTLVTCYSYHTRLKSETYLPPVLNLLAIRMRNLCLDYDKIPYSGGSCILWHNFL